MRSGKSLLSAAQTVRPAASLWIFGVFLVVVLLINPDFLAALKLSAPILSISMAGFCVNDILDREQDRINHPNRALSISPDLTINAIYIYLITFSISIFLILIQADNFTKFLWAILFIFLANYSFLKRNFPYLKNIYMGLTACFPVAIIDYIEDENLKSVGIYALCCLGVFARELSFDIPDIEGDDRTLAKLLGKRVASASSQLIFVAFIVGELMLAQTVLQLLSALIASILLLAYICGKVFFRAQEKTLFLISAGIIITPVLFFIG